MVMETMVQAATNLASCTNTVHTMADSLTHTLALAFGCPY